MLHQTRRQRHTKLLALMALVVFAGEAKATGAAAAAPPVQPPAPASGAPPKLGAPVPANAAAPAPGAPPAAKLNPSDPNVQAPTPSVNIFSGLMDPFDYDSRGRRDPFAQTVADKAVSGGPMHGPLLPLQRFELNQLRVMAILWDVHRPQAMIKDPSGNVYIITPNSKIGPHNGYVATIREGEIVVIETQEQDGRLVSTAQVVKIAK